MIDVIGVGASSVDFVYQLPHTPVPDSPTAKLRIRRQIISPGGQTATTMCTCAALGLRARYVGTVGNDAHARTLIEALTARGVDTSQVLPRATPSPYAIILLDEGHGERIVLWDRHPDAALQAGDVMGLDVSDARVVHVDDVDIDAALETARRARAGSARVTSDIEAPGPGAAALVEAVDVAILAEHVPQALVARPTLEESLRGLKARDDQWLAVTQGARGATLLAGGEVYYVGGHDVPVVDTTGAGDVFRGAFIVALLRGDAPGDILRFANAAAAASCTKLGAIGGIPTLAEVRALLAQ